MLTSADLVLCDYCEKAFHMKCHIPRLDKTPAGKWKCCECIAVKMTGKFVCMSRVYFTHVMLATE